MFWWVSCDSLRKTVLFTAAASTNKSLKTIEVDSDLTYEDVGNHFTTDDHCWMNEDRVKYLHFELKPMTEFVLNVLAPIQVGYMDIFKNNKHLVRIVRRKHIDRPETWSAVVRLEQYEHYCWEECHTWVPIIASVAAFVVFICCESHSLWKT